MGTENNARFFAMPHDERIITTCFLEYEPESVNIYDLMRPGLAHISSSSERGFVKIVAQ